MRLIYKIKNNFYPFAGGVRFVEEATHNFISNSQVIVNAIDNYYKDKIFLLNGIFHREGGPAVTWTHEIDPKIRKAWFLNGISYDENNYWKVLN